MFSTFYVFPLPPRKEIQLLPRFLCCVLFIWVLVEESVTTGVSSMAFFVVHAGFYSRVREKTKTFLTSLTSFQELHLMWVWVTPFFVSFNEHNYFNFLTVTRKIDFNFLNTSITLLSPFNEKCFCFKTFLMFWLSVKNFAFCYLAFVSSGFFRLECGSKCPVNESELLCGYMAYDLRLFAHSSSSPKKKNT